MYIMYSNCSPSHILSYPSHPVISLSSHVSLSYIYAFWFVTELTSTIYVMMDLADLPGIIGYGVIGHALKGVSWAQGTVQ